MSQPNKEHGTVQSYIVGFLLSLALTLIPYYLVVNQMVKGTVLLATILGFPVAQMIIQVTFFLHLGRGPKPRWNLFFFAATVSLILVVVAGSIVIIHNLHYNMAPPDQVQKLINDEGIYQIGGKKTGACQSLNANHKVTIQYDQLSPFQTNAIKCDSLTFINQDNVSRYIVFGTYPQHESYAGETNLEVRQGMNSTITLSASGTYQFYDRLHPEVTGSFNVSQ